MMIKNTVGTQTSTELVLLIFFDSGYIRVVCK